MLLLVVLIPLTAFPLTSTDYLNSTSVTASSAQFETVTTNNFSTVQVIPNAELVVVKRVLNDDGGSALLGDFNVSSDAGTLVFDAGTTTVDTTTYTSETLYLAPGTYSLTESDIDGYTEGSWSCTTGTVNDASFGAGSITLDIGQQTVCTITNDDVAPLLTLTKNLTNNNGGLKEIADFELSIDGNIVSSGVPNAVAANTVITISELDLPGYTAGSWSCTDDNLLTGGLPTTGLATGADLTLNPGSDVTCVISNDDIAPTLTLVKTLINDNGGNKNIEDFKISIDGAEVVSGDTNIIAANDLITISELDLEAYAEGTWACVDDNNITTGLPLTGDATSTILTALPGSAITCSITNNDQGIDLSIAKTVDDNTPNIGQEITFTLTVSNAGPDIATDVSVTDVVPAGFTYVSSSILGGDSADDSDAAGAGLSWSLNSVPVGAPIELSFKATVNAP